MRKQNVALLVISFGALTAAAQALADPAVQAMRDGCDAVALLPSGRRPLRDHTHPSIAHVRRVFDLCDIARQRAQTAPDHASVAACVCQMKRSRNLLAHLGFDVLDLDVHGMAFVGYADRPARDESDAERPAPPLPADQVR